MSTSAWYYDAVSYVYANGLMDGVSSTQFNPDGTMTRAMVWAILARIDGQTVTGDGWIETAREWAVAEGVSDGGERQRRRDPRAAGDHALALRGRARGNCAPERLV